MWCRTFGTRLWFISTPDTDTPCLPPAEGLWSGLSSDRTHRGEQVQHLRFGRVAQQEEAHVCGTERQRQANEGEENPKEKHCHSLPAHCGTTTMIGHVGQDRALQAAGCRTSVEFWTDLDEIWLMHWGGKQWKPMDILSLLDKDVSIFKTKE